MNPERTTSTTVAVETETGRYTFTATAFFQHDDGDLTIHQGDIVVAAFARGTWIGVWDTKAVAR